jgi:heme o synthase
MISWREWKYRWIIAKTPLCLLIGFSTFSGFLLSESRNLLQALDVSVGIFVLAMGAATLNSLQECREDSLMQRTRLRPLPTRSMTAQHAAVQAVLFLTGGFVFLLALEIQPLPAVLAGLALLLYNGLYTWLKQKTMYALVPGAICGAIPPVIGFLAGGGQLCSYRVVVLGGLFFLWQIPHFYLITLQFPEDYQDSIYPSFIRRLSAGGVNRLVVIWIMALVLVLILFTILPLNLSVATRIVLAVNAAFLACAVIWQNYFCRDVSPRILFIVLNMALFWHLVFLCAGRLRVF